MVWLCHVVQGSERSMLLEEVNGYKRALQHQALAKAQFGAPQPPGFAVQARAGAAQLLLSLPRCYPCTSIRVPHAKAMLLCCAV